MLNHFRQRGLTSVVYTFAIVSMMAVFVIQFRPAATSKTASLSETCAARVFSHCVTPKEFRTTYRMLMPQVEQDEESAQALASRIGLSKMTVDALVERELLIEEAKRLGVTASEDEISDQILRGEVRISVPDDNPAAVAGRFRGNEPVLKMTVRNSQTKAFDSKLYKRSLSQLGESDIEFREEQTRELIAAKVRDLVRAPVRVSDTEAFEAYVQRYSTATVAHIDVSTDYAGRYLLSPTEAEIKDWAKEHGAEIDAEAEHRSKDDSPKEGHIRHILVRVPSGADVSEKAIALGRIGLALQRLRSGVAFAEVAREFSDDSSKTTGGDVGTKTDSFVPPFRKAADALKPGEMTSTAIETQFGYHLIMRDDPSKAAAVEATIRPRCVHDLYVKSKATDAAKDFATKIASLMVAGKTGEQAIAEALKPYEKAPVALPTVTVTHPAEEPPAGAAAQPKHDDKPIAALAPTAMTDAARPKLQSGTEGFNPGGDPFDGLSPEGTAAVIQFAFSGKDGTTLAQPVKTAAGFAVVQLREHKVPTRQEFDKDGTPYVAQLLHEKKTEALALYVKRLRDQGKAHVKVDPNYTTDSKPNADAGASPSRQQPVEEEEAP